jgi:adenylosuccinate synthase
LKYVIAFSGPVASGKSAVVNEIVTRFNAKRVSTSTILLDRGTENRREALIEAGKELDRTTGGKWVSDGVVPYTKDGDGHDIVIVDAVRTADQVRLLRERFGQEFVHVHVSVPFDVARDRYAARGAVGDRHVSYDEVKADPTESGVWQLDRIADRVVENHLAGPASGAAGALAGLGLLSAVNTVARVRATSAPISPAATMS